MQSIKMGKNTTNLLVLLYVDDCLTIGENALEQLNQIDKYFPMKPSSIGPPKIYLGAKIGQIELKNGVKAFYFSMLQYVQEAIRNVEKHMAQRNLALIKKASIPITTDDSPDLDGSEELDETEATYYQSLIGILC